LEQPDDAGTAVSIPAQRVSAMFEQVLTVYLLIGLTYLELEARYVSD
jgi:hypothetical protein